MPNRPTTLILPDPREFDGDPYQVAERAIQQLAGILDAFDALVEPTDLMLRNAELERLMALGVEGDDLRTQARAWPESPQAARLKGAQDLIREQKEALVVLSRAARYDPKAIRGTHPRGRRKP